MPRSSSPRPATGRARSRRRTPSPSSPATSCAPPASPRSRTILRRVPGVDVMAMSPADYNIGSAASTTACQQGPRPGRRPLGLLRSTSAPRSGRSCTISPADVERIEIVRGPGAALYGANAFSGVINIITRSPGRPATSRWSEVWGGFPDQGGASLRLTNRRRGDRLPRLVRGRAQAPLVPRD